MQPNDTYNVQNFTLYGNDDTWFSAIGTYSGPGEMLDVFSKIDPCNGCGSRKFRTIEGFDGVSDSLIDEFQVDYNSKQSNSGVSTKTSMSDKRVPTGQIEKPSVIGSDSGMDNHGRDNSNRSRGNRNRGGRRSRGPRGGYPYGSYGYEYDDYYYNDPIAYPIPVPVEVPVEVPVAQESKSFMLFDYAHILILAIVVILAILLMAKFVFKKI